MASGSGGSSSSKESSGIIGRERDEHTGVSQILIFLVIYLCLLPF